MKILTLITKKSVKEIIREKKFLRFYTTEFFNSGEMIEIIDGNKKSPAIILKSESIQDLKEKIRGGDLEIKKLKFSKTGDYALGKIIDIFPISEIKKFLKDPLSAQQSKNEHIRKFFPKKRKHLPKSTTDKTKGSSSSVADILKNRVSGRPKTYHNEMQEIVDIVRNYFGEKAVYGQGSFSYYIGFFKNMPLREVHKIFGEVKQTKKSIFDKKKLFWYKVGKYIKEKRSK